MLLRDSKSILEVQLFMIKRREAESKMRIADLILKLQQCPPDWWVDMTYSVEDHRHTSPMIVKYETPVHRVIVGAGRVSLCDKWA